MSSSQLTRPFLSKYERARLIATRAEALEHNADPMISVNASITSAVRITELELQANVCPLVLRRTFPNGRTEQFDPVADNARPDPLTTAFPPKRTTLVGPAPSKSQPKSQTRAGASGKQ